MQHVDRMIGAVAVALGVVVLSGCAMLRASSNEAGAASFNTWREAVIPASSPPPAKRAEIPPPAPSPQALWDTGHWSWDGVRYAWTPGRYIERPQPDANWIPGYWQQEAGGWTWIEGRWRS
jgi:hypothetical protein